MPPEKVKEWAEFLEKAPKKPEDVTSKYRPPWLSPPCALNAQHAQGPSRPQFPLLALPAPSTVGPAQPSTSQPPRSMRDPPYEEPVAVVTDSSYTKTTKNRLFKEHMRLQPDDISVVKHKIHDFVFFRWEPASEQTADAELDTYPMPVCLGRVLRVQKPTVAGGDTVITVQYYWAPHYGTVWWVQWRHKGMARGKDLYKGKISASTIVLATVQGTIEGGKGEPYKKFKLGKDTLTLLERENDTTRFKEFKDKTTANETNAKRKEQLRTQQRPVPRPEPAPQLLSPQDLRPHNLDDGDFPAEHDIEGPHCNLDKAEYHPESDMDADSDSNKDTENDDDEDADEETGSMPSDEEVLLQEAQQDAQAKVAEYTDRTTLEVLDKAQRAKRRKKDGGGGGGRVGLR